MMRKINWLFLVTGTIVMLYVMALTGRSLKTPETPLGILNLEFAYNISKADAVINAWKPVEINDTDNIRVAIKNTWLDFIFLFFYSLFLFYTCKTISESFSGILYKLGMLFAMGALNAGLLDIAENAGMLLTLNGYLAGNIVLLTTVCAVVKWILALAAVAYILLVGPFALYKGNKRS